MVNLKLGKKKTPCLTQIYFLEYLLWQLRCPHWFRAVAIFSGYFDAFSDSASEGVRQTNFGLLCLWNCQIQADILRELVRKNTSQGFSTWVSFLCLHHTGALRRVGAGCVTQDHLFTAQQCKLWHTWNPADTQHWKSMDLSALYITSNFYWCAWHFELRCVWDCICKISLWGERFLCFFSYWKLRLAYNVGLGDKILRKRPQSMGNTLIFWFFSCANLSRFFSFKVFWIISVKFGEFWVLLPKDINCIYRTKNTLSSLSLLVEYPNKKHLNFACLGF